MRPYIIKERCAAQQSICPPMKACVNKAISYIVDEEELLGGRIIIDHEKCKSCGKCVDICCGHCIEMR